MISTSLYIDIYKLIYWYLQADTRVWKHGAKKE